MRCIFTAVNHPRIRTQPTIKSLSLKIDDNSVSVKCDLEEQSIVQLLMGRGGSHPAGP